VRFPTTPHLTPIHARPNLFVGAHAEHAFELLGHCIRAFCFLENVADLFARIRACAALQAQAVQQLCERFRTLEPAVSVALIGTGESVVGACALVRSAFAHGWPAHQSTAIRRLLEGYAAAAAATTAVGRTDTSTASVVLPAELAAIAKVQQHSQQIAVLVAEAQARMPVAFAKVVASAWATASSAAVGEAHQQHQHKHHHQHYQRHVMAVCQRLSGLQNDDSAEREFIGSAQLVFCTLAASGRSAT
jgi:hypothetical protein